MLRHNLRDIDQLARPGGEEFGVLLPNTEAGDAVKMAARLREASAETPYLVDGQPIIVTLSIGAATYDKEMQNFDHLLKAADTAMYQAKSLGRNRVVYLG
jgi:diguanylate cyclase (GGDEF)-like protein